VSIRRACRALPVDRSTYHYRSSGPASTSEKRDGIKLRVLAVVGTFTRYSPPNDVLRRYRGADVVATLERAAAVAGHPKVFRVDNGPEFVSKELDLWAFMKEVTLTSRAPVNRPTTRSLNPSTASSAPSVSTHHGS
jgi:transposase InsO family protein